MPDTNKVCRTCLGCCPQEYYSLHHGTPSYEFKLQECIPFMDLTMIIDPIICTTCARMLDRSYQMLITARNVETRLYQYIKKCSKDEACYIMAHKPVADSLECLTYRTVVDDVFNFRMVVAVVDKMEIIENKMETRVKEIISENIDRDYDDLEMPNLDQNILSPKIELNNEPFLSHQINPISSEIDPLINQMKNHFLLSVNNYRNDNINSTVSSTPAHNVTQLTTKQQQQNFVEQTNVQRTFSCKIAGPSTSTTNINNTSQSQITAPISISNEVNLVCAPVTRSSKRHKCALCKGKCGNIALHMQVQSKNSCCIDTVKTTQRAFASSAIKCVQCGWDYKKSDGHKCLFSSYIRLERQQWLDDLARLNRRSLLLKRRKLVKQRAHSIFPHNVGTIKHTVDIIDDNMLNTSKGVAVTADNRSVIESGHYVNIDDAIVSDSSTLSALSTYSEEYDKKQSTITIDPLLRCAVCQLRFDNNLQLRRHLSLNHNTDGIRKNQNNNLTSFRNNVFDEHSYAWLSSIQCWNCSHCFSTPDEWLTHDYIQHEATFLICYICFRGFKSTHIISHLTNAHSLSMREKKKLPMTTNKKRTTAKKDWRKCGILVDETFSRICRFIMFAYKLTHCPLCQKPCGSASLLMCHLVLNRCTKSRCLLCQIDLYSSLHLLDHLMTLRHKKQIIATNIKVKEKYLCCPVCDAVFVINAAFLNHSCLDENNPNVLYKRKMGLWACSECLIISPFAITSKLHHILSAVHLKRRFYRLVNSIKIKNDLSCHLCPKVKTHMLKFNLIDHLKGFHIESQSVLCPLCHFMALSPNNFTSHLNTAHTNFLLSQDVHTSIVKTSTANSFDIFTCRLCDRNHRTLNSFWETCGQGHKGLSLTLDKVLKYLDLFDDKKCVQFTGVSYNCECGRAIQTGSDLYKHYRGLKDLTFFDSCSFWACCDECGALVSPRNKLGKHIEKEHNEMKSDKCTVLNRNMKCTYQNELLEDTSTQNAENETITLPLSGKRKRRRTQLYLEINESGGLLAMEHKLQNEFNTCSKEHRRCKSYSSTNVFTTINLAEVQKINSPSMQPVVELKKLDQSLIHSTYRDVVSTCYPRERKELHSLTDSTTKNINFDQFDMMETVDRVGAKFKSNELNTDDHSSSSGSNLVSSIEPDAIEQILQSEAQSTYSNHANITSSKKSSTCQRHIVDMVDADSSIFPNKRYDNANLTCCPISNSGATNVYNNIATGIQDASNAAVAHPSNINLNFSGRRKEKLKKNANFCFKERDRRIELSRLLLNLRKQLQFNGFLKGKRPVAKKNILKTSLQVIRFQQNREKLLISESDKWLKIVEVKEAILKQLRLHIVLESSGKKTIEGP